MNSGKLLLIKENDHILGLLFSEDRLCSVKVYKKEHFSLVGNIYVGKVVSIAENINAAFVEISPGESCFLSLKDAANPCMIKGKGDRLRPGDEILVQVTRDAVKTKQPVLTANISISGNYLAATHDANYLGMSAKLSDEKKREIACFLKENGLIDDKNVCLQNTGMIVRTNAGKLTDYTPIMKEWEALSEELSLIFATAIYRTCYSCLKQNLVPYVEDLKNYYTGEFDEIITDCEDIYESLQNYYAEYAKMGIPAIPVRLYNDTYPLRKLYSVDSQLDMALNRRIWLKSGGYLIIEPTEALTVIDVNTGKYEGNKSSEETYFLINMEAAKEIALQLKLRNLSGIIIVDFINMSSDEKKMQLMQELKAYVKKDSTKTTVVDITPLGLVEITRKKISAPISELLKG